uniref:Alpha-1B-glycoprotein-like n=1 Tax=Pelodiscus sinensis TaxID=13735 RepID=K7G4W4_PELSI
MTLTCSATSTDTVSGIRFFRDGKSIDYGELQQSQSNAKLLELSRVSESDTGLYSCESWKTESEREIPSERSQTISITVTARPPAPTLSVSPQHRVFLRGESVTLTCSAPSTDTVSRIRFFRDGKEISSADIKPNAKFLQLSSVSETDAGEYSCEYWKKESEREIPSERSRTISINVTARMPAPTLTVSPSYRVFLPRESVTLTCSAPSTDTVTLIQFFRDGQKINSNVKSHQLSSVSERDAGAYSCEYWKKESEREIPSERSRPISI